MKALYPYLVLVPLFALAYCHKPTPIMVSPASMATPAPYYPGMRLSRVDSDGVTRYGYYKVTSLYPKQWNYTTWEYTLNPDGSIHFTDHNTGRGRLVSPPFTVEEITAADGWKPPES